jgi:hemoglobin
MPLPQACSEDEIRRVVETFYESARADPMLGPIFEARVGDWPRHIARMVDFWSSALLGTARYRGTPLLAHTALPGLRAELFTRWLQLFRRSAEGFASAECRERANSLAQQIAESLWWGYQNRHNLLDPPGPSSPPGRFPHRRAERAHG